MFVAILLIQIYTVLNMDQKIYNVNKDLFKKLFF